MEANKRLSFDRYEAELTQTMSDLEVAYRVNERVKDIKACETIKAQLISLEQRMDALKSIRAEEPAQAA